MRTGKRVISSVWFSYHRDGYSISRNQSRIRTESKFIIVQRNNNVVYNYSRVSYSLLLFDSCSSRKVGFIDTNQNILTHSSNEETHDMATQHGGYHYRIYSFVETCVELRRSV